MKNILTVALLALTTITTAGNTTTPSTMNIEVFEENGVTRVREVVCHFHHPSFLDTQTNKNEPQPRSLLGSEAPACRQCVHVGGQCKVGDGSCYEKERASCTYCGPTCKAKCIPDGASCEQYCL